MEKTKSFFSSMAASVASIAATAYGYFYYRVYLYLFPSKRTTFSSEDIQTYQNLNSKNVAKMIMSAPNLESIYIRSLNYDNTPQALDLKPGALSKLKSIQIESSWIKADVLASLIFASPNLETINLSGRDVGLPELTTTSGSYPLSNLKSIQLSNKYLDPNSLNKIFAFAYSGDADHLKLRSRSVKTLS